MFFIQSACLHLFQKGYANKRKPVTHNLKHTICQLDTGYYQIRIIIMQNRVIMIETAEALSQIIKVAGNERD